MTQEAIQATQAAGVLVATYSAPWTVGTEYMVPILGIGGALIVAYSAICGYLNR